jgi:hypothetical protein
LDMQKKLDIAGCEKSAPLAIRDISKAETAL